MTPLGRALRQRFPRGPKQALRALGLPANLLDVKRMAFDARHARDEIPELDRGELRQALEKLLIESGLSGHALQKARETLENHLGGGEYDFAIQEQEAEAEDDEEREDDEPDAEARREERRGWLKTVADFLSTHKGMSESEIAETLADMPKNGLERIGGALAKDLDDLMKDRQSRMATDAKRKRKAFDSRYPQGGRLGGTALETSYGDPVPARRIATDGAAEKSFAERFPEAARIG